MTTKGCERTRYAEQLSDPRWKTLRDRIIQRDGGACVQCRGNGELHVHHSHYRAGRDPWQYRDTDLFTLCKRCHEKVHGLTVDRDLDAELVAAQEDVERYKQILRTREKETGPEAADLLIEVVARIWRVQELQHEREQREAARCCPHRWQRESAEDRQERARKDALSPGTMQHRETE